MRIWQRIFSILLVVSFSVVTVFANSQQESGSSSTVIKMGDNLPDRSVGLGAVAEAVNAEFIKLHPDAKFEIESYQDQAYQEKIKIYATADQLPDIMKYWSFTNMLKPLVDGGFLAELDKDSLSKYSWIPGSLEGNMIDGKLYGVPVTTDFWVVFYNKAIFDEVGLAYPKTMEEMVEAGKVIKAAGYIPMVTDGKDGWPLCETYDNIFWRLTGDYSIMSDVLSGKGSFNDPEFVEAAKVYQDFFLNSGLFGDDLLTTDYGASRNLFGQKQAAMYLMGSWEMGLATDENFSEEFRANIRAGKFPEYANGKGSQNDLLAWYGGNYIVKANSDNEELAKEYIDLYSSMYAKTMWDLQAGFPAQAVTGTDSDTQLAKDLLGILSNAEATSGTPSIDVLDSAFKETIQNLCQDLAGGFITPEEFCAQLDVARLKAIN